MKRYDWFETNRVAILRRLSRLINEPQGILYTKRTELHDVVIRKVGTQIHLIFVDPTADEIMSRIDITNPLNLLACYTQAMMLSLVWKSEPNWVYMIGFGGGRVPMILHHYFPTVKVESTDIEPTVLEIATKFWVSLNSCASRVQRAQPDGSCQTSDTRKHGA